MEKDISTQVRSRENKCELGKNLRGRIDLLQDIFPAFFLLIHRFVCPFVVLIIRLLLTKDE